MLNYYIKPDEDDDEYNKYGDVFEY